MPHETTSKNLDGITDLVVVAPIKKDFIAAYENVTYATRLRIVAEALNRIRVAAREYEPAMPYSDVTARILTLLDFRVGILDKDLFALPLEGELTDRDPRDENETELRSRRYLYLTATFDGAWEPYMRLIWDPLGPFLDLLFCNCEGYVTAAEHSFEEFAQWVRDNQMDSAIFYATTGLTIRDQFYLERMERVQRAMPGAESDLEIAQMTMPQPEDAAKAERVQALKDLLQNGDRRRFMKAHELALEALTVLYRLADYYPPEWLANRITVPDLRNKTAKPLSEGQYLIRASESLLKGWQDLLLDPPPPGWGTIEQLYADPLNWYREGLKYLRKLEAARKPPNDPRFRESEIQGGLLRPQGSKIDPMRQGALLLMTVTDAKRARRFMKQLEKQLEINYAAGPGAVPADGFFRTIAFTADGLRRIGLPKGLLDWFPKEFREGMETRSGLIGDMRENHPRNWPLPQRNWPLLPATADPFAKARPAVELSEVDIVIQIRTASTDRQALIDEIARLAAQAAPGVTLQAFELMHGDYDLGTGKLRDYFGFQDGFSQPHTPPQPADPRPRDQVRLGELLLGYGNDRSDFAPVDFLPADPAHPTETEKKRIGRRRESLRYQRDGSFLVVRKLEQNIDTFEAFVATEARRINLRHPRLMSPMTADRLKARMLGRYPDGTPLVPPHSPAPNDFDYAGDPKGELCPFAAHIRRTNPRDSFQGRKAPRLFRRGMSFNHLDGVGGAGGRGLMFMAYNASIAEQFETIQRWINGGNSTFVASGHNDPMLGVAPRTGVADPAQRVFRFVEEEQPDPVSAGKKVAVIRVAMPDPFVSLHWGLYLFVPSRKGLAKLCALPFDYQPMNEILEEQGEEVLNRLAHLGDKEAGREWKRLLEDFDAKDPTERDISPDMWAAIRWFKGGAYRVKGGVPTTVPFLTASLPGPGATTAPVPPTPPPPPNWDQPPDADTQPMVLAASPTHVMRVLSDWRHFTTEEQLRRITIEPGKPGPAGIPIFVTQQPDNRYKSTALHKMRYRYRHESEATNAILMTYDEAAGFRAGYDAGRKVLERLKNTIGLVQGYYEMELRREYVLPALKGLCETWYGVPDGVNFFEGAWAWQAPDDRPTPGPCCPGDFLSPSRHAFYPRPGPVVSQLAGQHGKAVIEGSRKFVAEHRQSAAGLGTIAKAMFDEIPNTPDGNEVLARNLVGTMIGAIPPMDGNLRGILLEWLVERTLWRNQAALRNALRDRPADTNIPAALDALRGPVSQAMCKRPAPDLLYRTALKKTTLQAGAGYPNQTYDPKYDVVAEERDLVVVSLVSAAQHSLANHKTPYGKVSIVFGGERRAPYQPGTRNIRYPVHACPAQKLAMGAIMGIMAALLDAGRIQALPASLIVRISGWPRP